MSYARSTYRRFGQYRQQPQQDGMQTYGYARIRQQTQQQPQPRRHPYRLGVQRGPTPPPLRPNYEANVRRNNYRRQLEYGKRVLVRVPNELYARSERDASKIIAELCDVRRCARLSIESYMSDFCDLCKVYAADPVVEELCEDCFRVRVDVAMSVEFLGEDFDFGSIDDVFPDDDTRCSDDDDDEDAQCDDDGDTQCDDDMDEEDTDDGGEPKTHGSVTTHGGVKKKKMMTHCVKKKMKETAARLRAEMLARWAENWEYVQSGLDEATSRLGTVLRSVFALNCIVACVPTAFCDDVLLEIRAGSIAPSRLCDGDIRGLVIPVSEATVQRAAMQFAEKHMETRDVLLRWFAACNVHVPIVRGAAFRVKTCGDALAFLDCAELPSGEKRRRVAEIASAVATRHGAGSPLSGNISILARLGVSGVRCADEFRVDCDLFVGADEPYCFGHGFERLDGDDVAACFAFYLRQTIGCLAPVVSVETAIVGQCGEQDDEECGDAEHAALAAAAAAVDEGCRWVRVDEYLDQQSWGDE